MKYYAVTDDPKELMHFGIKGMKWGVIRTDAQLGHLQAPKMPKGMKSKQKVRSDAYRKASSKLSEGMRHGIAKAKAKIADYNSPVNKSIRAAKKKEKLFQKHLQQARKGTLKYKKVSDDEVYRIADRLNMERASRALSGAEQTFRNKLKTSIGEGVVKGVGQGVASSIQTRMGSRAETKAAIKKDKQMAAYRNSLQGRIAQRRNDRADIRKAKAEGRKEADKATAKEMASLGIKRIGHVTRRGRAEAIERAKERRDEAAESSKLQKEYRKLAIETAGYTDESGQVLKFDPEGRIPGGKKNERISDNERIKRLAAMREAANRHEYELKRTREEATNKSKNDKEAASKIEESATKLYEAQMKRVDRAEEAYQKRYDAWVANSRQGPRPSRRGLPKPPDYETIYSQVEERYKRYGRTTP